MREAGAIDYVVGRAPYSALAKQRLGMARPGCRGARADAIGPDILRQGLCREVVAVRIHEIDHARDGLGAHLPEHLAARRIAAGPDLSGYPDSRGPECGDQSLARGDGGARHVAAIAGAILVGGYSCERWALIPVARLPEGPGALAVKEGVIHHEAAGDVPDARLPHIAREIFDGGAEAVKVAARVRA